MWIHDHFPHYEMGHFMPFIGKLFFAAELYMFITPLYTVLFEDLMIICIINVPFSAAITTHLVVCGAITNAKKAVEHVLQLFVEGRD